MSKLRWALLFLVLLAGPGVWSGEHSALYATSLRAEHWLYVAAAWPAENATRVNVASLGFVHKAAARQPAFVSWPAWLRTPSEAHYRHLHAHTGHNRTVRALVLVEALGPPTLALLLLLWRLASGGALGHLAPSTALGSARWASRREVRALTPRDDGLGLVLGSAGRQVVSLPESAVYQNVLAVGPPGTGKSASLYIPILLGAQGRRSLVVVDVKGELVDTTLPAVARHHDVLVLNVVDPSVSVPYNPLAHIHGYMDAELFARVWVTNTGTSINDTFWDEMARQLITAGILHLRALDVMPGLGDLADFLCGQDSRAIMAAFAVSPSSQAKAMGARLLDNMHKNERLAGSVFAGMPLRWSLLQDEGVRAVTATNALDFAPFALGSGRATALYVVLDFTRKEEVKPLVATFFTQLFRFLRAQAGLRDDKALPRPLLLLLDEFGTMGHIPGIADDLATLRSARVGCVLAVQATSQLASTYGKDARATILTACGTKLGFPGMDEDAEWFSAQLGTHTVLAHRADATRTRGSARARSGTDGVNEQARRLLTPDEVTRLAEHEVLVLRGNRHPVRLRQRRYYEDRTLLMRTGCRMPDGSRMPVGGPKRAEAPDLEAVANAEQAAWQAGRRAHPPVPDVPDGRIPSAFLWGEELEQEETVDPEQAAFQRAREAAADAVGMDERRADEAVYLPVWEEQER